jgi:hypothetical protein
VRQTALSDGSSYGVFAQRFVTPIVLDAGGNGVYDALTDGLLILRHAFGFVGDTLISGAVGAGCTRCMPAAILGYLDDLAEE